MDIQSMSGPRQPGESFDEYRAACKVEKLLENVHRRGHLAFVAVQYFEKDGKTYKRSRTFVKPKENTHVPQ